MKSLKLASAAAALVLSTSANAAIISYGGYTHDTDTDIVTGNGLEWLQWDRTVGESINSIQSQLNSLDGGGWSVASNVQMAQLFNAFAFNFGYVFDSDENTRESVYTGYSQGDPGTEADELFINMFGDTYLAGGSTYCYGSNCLTAAIAYFGTDPDSDGTYNLASVYDDYIDNFSAPQSGAATLFADGYYPSVGYQYYGIALVRDVSAVPVPAAVWLFGSGLIGLAGIARRKKA